MKIIIRFMVGYVSMLPFAAAYHLITRFSTKEQALRLTGKALTYVSAMYLRTAIPLLRHPADFIKFKKAVPRNIGFFDILHEIHLSSESEVHFQLSIVNCPFTSALRGLHVPQLSKYACAADFVLAKENRERWIFSRTHSHGTDGQCCNQCFRLPEGTG